jgi:hypothetical protein
MTLRSSRSPRSLLVPLAAASALVIAAACGNSKPASTPKGEGDVAALGSTTGAEPTPGNLDGGPTTTTTTMALPDSGDLTGVKIATSSSRTVEVKSDAGTPKEAPAHKAEPGRSPTDIYGIVGARRDEARACYDKVLDKNPKIAEGDLVIKFVIDPKGAVGEAGLDTTQSQINEPEVTACIVEFIKKFKFAESAGGYQTTTNYKFGFKRGARKKP